MSRLYEIGSGKSQMNTANFINIMNGVVPCNNTVSVNILKNKIITYESPIEYVYDWILKTDINVYKQVDNEVKIIQYQNVFNNILCEDLEIKQLIQSQNKFVLEKSDLKIDMIRFRNIFLEIEQSDNNSLEKELTMVVDGKKTLIHKNFTFVLFGQIHDGFYCYANFIKNKEKEITKCVKIIVSDYYDELLIWMCDDLTISNNINNIKAEILNNKLDSEIPNKDNKSKAVKLKI